MKSNKLLDMIEVVRETERREKHLSSRRRIAEREVRDREEMFGGDE